MIEYVAIRCPHCSGVLTELLSGASYPPFRVRCRKRGCGIRATVMGRGEVVLMGTPLARLSN